MTTNDNIVFLPFDDIESASGICKVVRNAWWVTHPENGLAFYNRKPGKNPIVGASPQCNSDKSVTELVLAKLYPWAEIKQIPLVIIPIDISDYAY